MRLAKTAYKAESGAEQREPRRGTQPLIDQQPEQEAGDNGGGEHIARTYTQQPFIVAHALSRSKQSDQFNDSWPSIQPLKHETSLMN